MKLNSKRVILSLVFFVTGFILSFSYQFTSEGSENEGNVTEKQWQREAEVRRQLLKQEERNKELQDELMEKQKLVNEAEERLAEQEQILFNLVEDVKKLRLIAGDVAVKGPGIEVTLSDASYIPDEENANNYIVHDSHVQMLINELRASGAVSAIAVNGQRISNNSYVTCVGPVITVDNNQYPAPFVISAIGDPLVLEGSLNLPQGVKDRLVNDNIQVKIEKKDEIVMEPLLGKERW